MDNFYKDDNERTPLLTSDQSSKIFYSSVNEVTHENVCNSHDKVSVNVSRDDLDELHQLSSPPEDKQEILSEILNELSVSSDQSERKQSSLVTIFAIWNTMLGTSILTIPWALQRAGFVCGILLIIGMAGLCLYTAYRVIQVQTLIGVDGLRIDFSDVCRILLGRWAEWISWFFSVASLFGAMIVYWILMSNFLYNTVAFIFSESRKHEMSYTYSLPDDAVCKHNNSSDTKDPKEFREVWNLSTTPLFLSILIVPLINFRSPTFFTKFNALGIISPIFILSFIIVKANKWGINVTFSNDESTTGDYVPMFQWSFPELSGTLTLGYFIHNCITSILRNQKNLENNGRDLSIAYCLVALTYGFVGVMFLIAFPLPKYCIADNLLNNITSTDTLSFVARLFLLFQMMTVFPLLLYIIRIQSYSQIFQSREPTMKFILILNLLLVTVAMLVAIYYPHMGQLIRYTGAFCGVAYSFALPCLTYLMAKRWQGQLTNTNVAVHVIIIILGVINLGAQFVPFKN